jgi:hypothetical protein
MPTTKRTSQSPKRFADLGSVAIARVCRMYAELDDRRELRGSDGFKRHTAVMTALTGYMQGWGPVRVSR